MFQVFLPFIFVHINHLEEMFCMFIVKLDSKWYCINVMHYSEIVVHIIFLVVDFIGTNLQWYIRWFVSGSFWNIEPNFFKAVTI